MSRFGAIEASCLAQLVTITSFAEVKAIAPSVASLARPEAYPAAWLMLTGMKQVEKPIQTLGHSQYLYDVELGVLIFGSSDGITIGDGRPSAWAQLDLTIDAFTNFQPTGLTDTSIYPLTIGDPENTFTDAGLSALYLPMAARIAWYV